MWCTSVPPLLLFCSSVFVCSFARAQEIAAPPSDLAEARSAFDRGVEHFKSGDFNAATADFEAALRLKPHPSVLLNLGRAYAASGRPLDAVRVLKQYLVEQDSVLTASKRDTVNALLSSEQQRLGTIAIRTRQAGVAISVDGTAVGVSPLAEAVLMAPGNHVVRGERSGFISAVTTIEVEPSRESEVELDLEPVQATARVAPIPPQRSPTRSARTAPGAAASDVEERGRERSAILRRLGIVTLGVSAASFAVGSYFAVRATNSWADRNHHCPAGECDELAVEDWRDTKRFALVTDVSFALGLVAAGAGAYLLLTQGEPSARTESANRVGVSVNRDSWFVQVRGSL